MTKHKKVTKKVQIALGLAAAGLFLGACGSSDSATETSVEATETSVTATDCPAADLVAAGEAEGQVNLITLPDTWANYKGILQSYRDKYAIKNPVANPDGSSADELVAVETLAGQPDMPDAVDVSPAFAQEFDTKGLWEPYQPCLWDEIPETLKDPDGKWVAAYYGLMAIGANTTVLTEVPTSFAALKDPMYKGLVSLNGDPRESGAAFAAVMAAAIANGGSFDDILPGIEYFAELKKSGNLSAADVTAASVISGETPLVLDWTYNYPGIATVLEENGITFQVTVPTDGVYGGYYAQGVVKNSPHQNASKLWINHLISDEGALGYIVGGAIPARFDALVAAGKVSEEMMKNLPDPALTAGIKFPSAEQVAKAKEVLTAQWGPLVADK
jgi:putative spermidine/putrescine transport system substrate-binding protein